MLVVGSTEMSSLIEGHREQLDFPYLIASPSARLTPCVNAEQRLILIATGCGTCENRMLEEDAPNKMVLVRSTFMW